MFSYDNYETQRCEVHKTIIIYFKSNKMMDQTHCWDCQRDANKRKQNGSSLVQPQADDPNGDDRTTTG
jgi:hypothetical protein